MPFLAHADAQPAVCMLLVLQALPLPTAPEQGVLEALRDRIAVRDPGMRQSMLARLFGTTLELLQVRLLWGPCMCGTFCCVLSTAQLQPICCCAGGHVGALHTRSSAAARCCGPRQQPGAGKGTIFAAHVGCSGIGR